jgi:hypothetical protein
MNSYEMILDRPRLNTHQKSALLYELAWSDQQSFEQAVVLIEQTQIELTIPNDLIDDEVRELIEQIPMLNLIEDRIIIDMSSLQLSQQSMNLYRTLILLNREDDPNQKLQLLLRLIELL